MPQGECVAGQLLKSFVPSLKKWTGFYYILQPN